MGAIAPESRERPERTATLSSLTCSTALPRRNEFGSSLPTTALATMPRSVFSAKVKKASWERSGGVCEAVGAVYGLEPGTRCTASISPGSYDSDHYPLPAHAENSNTLENCWCVCKSCHSYKTRNFDIPYEAKRKRLLRKSGPVEQRKRKQPIPKPKNHKWPKQKWPTAPKNQRDIDDPERTALWALTNPVEDG